jgi:hypothetical protein
MFTELKKLFSRIHERCGKICSTIQLVCLNHWKSQVTLIKHGQWDSAWSSLSRAPNTLTWLCYRLKSMPCSEGSSRQGIARSVHIHFLFICINYYCDTDGNIWIWLHHFSLHLVSHPLLKSRVPRSSYKVDDYQWFRVDLSMVYRWGGAAAHRKNSA